MEHKSIDLRTAFQIIASDKVQGDLLRMCELLLKKEWIPEEMILFLS